jgi:signal transduction histidine kinase
MMGIPVRLRVAAGFAVAMAIVLVGTGAFLYASLGRDLARALDDDLRLRAQDLSTIAGDPDRSLATKPGARLIERGETFAQLLAPNGAVLDETAQLGGRSLLSASQRSAALTHAAFSDLPQIPGLDEGVRLLSTPVRRDRRRLILVVGATAENRREALRSLRDELLVVGPVALLLASGLGYLLAGAGLRTVEAMRAHAARISADTPEERLPVPATGDELQRLGRTLNEMLARLQDALERERSFVADASHELRTPLALMRAELDYALHYAETEQELRAAIRTASDETDRLVALAAALLLIAASDRGQLALRREPTDAGELVDSVRQRFAWRAEELGRPLIAERPAAPVTLDADRLRLEQALGNLVDNALRHGEGTVRIAAARAGHDVALCVCDDGPGFAAELLPHAFERFSRGEAHRAGDGSGLGLAIVRTIAKAHGGTVEAAGSGTPGARVTLRLPGSPLRTANRAPIDSR